MVHTFICHLIAGLKKKHQCLNKVHYFSDGCSAQYKGLLSTGPMDDWAQALWTPCFDVYINDCHKLGLELFYAYHAPHNN